MQGQEPNGAQQGGGYPGQNMIRPAQVSQFYLEGMRPEMGHGNPWATRTIAQPVALQRTQTIRNDVNLKKNTLRLVRDASAPSRYHLEFTFDAAAPCNVSVYYAASERIDKSGKLTITPLKESGAHPPEARGKGLNQQFRTRDSHALDTSLYAPSELQPVAGDAKAGVAARFPIVVCLEATGSASAQPTNSTVTSQTTFAKLSAPDADGTLTVLPMKQKIQVGSHSYELQEIYGISDGAGGAAAGGGEAVADADGAADGEGVENSRECVICMTEPRDTTVLPCRHMCMCSECANVLRMQSEKCPICRTPISSLLKIQINRSAGGEGDATPEGGTADAADAAPSDGSVPDPKLVS